MLHLWQKCLKMEAMSQQQQQQQQQQQPSLLIPSKLG
jgi:hypothetical protein